MHLLHARELEHGRRIDKKEDCLNLIECENRVALGKPAESFAKERHVQMPDRHSARR